MQASKRAAATAAMSAATFLPAAASAAPQGPVGPGEILSLGTGLVLVIGAILVTGWLYARTQKGRVGGSNLIQVVASQPLGTRERVVLLQVAEKQLLVGMTSSQVQTLHVFDEPVIDAGEPRQNGFAERLRDAIKGKAQ